jgi:hypothetical protein
MDVLMERWVTPLLADPLAQERFDESRASAGKPPIYRTAPKGM